MSYFVLRALCPLMMSNTIYMMMLKTGMAMYIQVPKIGPQMEGSTVVEAEQKHIGRVEIEFCPSAQRRDVLEGDLLPTKRSTLS
jgi:hypothetical protein